MDLGYQIDEALQIIRGLLGQAETPKKVLSQSSVR